MENSAKKIGLGLSVVIIMICVILAIGSTFSIFTGKTDADININAGNITLAASLTNLKTSSLGVAQESGFANLGTATIDGTVLTLENVTPGDEAQVTIEIKNTSSVAIAYRLQFIVAGELAEVLEISVDQNGTNIPLDVEYTEWKYTTAANQPIDNITVKILLPKDVDDTYQSKSATIDFNLEAVQSNGVGELGGTQYASTAEGLQNALNNGGDITLYDNIVVEDGASLTIPEGKTVTLDLNGYTISSNASTATIINNGTLTVNGGSLATTFRMRAAKIGTIANAKSNALLNNGTLTINGGVFTSGAAYAFNNAAGTIEINGAAGGGLYNNGTATLNDCALTNEVSGRHGIYNSGDLTINGGVYESTSGNELINSPSENPTVINGGVFNMIGKSYLFAGNVLVKHGVLNGYKNADGTVDTPRPNGGSNNTVIENGIVNFDATAWLADGLMLGDNGDGTSTVLPSEGIDEGVKLYYHAESGLYYNGEDTFFVFDNEDLLKAKAYFAGASHSNEAVIVTIELLADIDLAGESWTPWDVMWIIFNGNGHTVSNVTVDACWRAGFFGYAGAVKVNDLTLENVTANGAQVGILAGSAEALTATNCFIKGNNVVNYVTYSSEDYTETWGGAGAVTGVVYSSTINVEIAEGATVAVNYDVLNTYCDYIDELTGYLQANNGTITNNGTVTVTGETHKNIADGVYQNFADTTTYYIYSANGLYWFAGEVNKYSNYERPFEGETLVLTTDIDLGGAEWIPIGDYRFSANRFCGTFDGQEHTISNFKITKKTSKNDSNKSSYGFFGNMEGTVKNLTIDNAQICTYAYVGALVGRLTNGTIENCHVTNSTVESTYWQAGGMVGQINDNCTIKNSTVTNTSVIGASAIGGMFGPVTATNGDEAKTLAFENLSIKDSAVIQKGSFGPTYDPMFGRIFCDIEVYDNATVINNCTAENTSLKGEVAEFCIGGGVSGSNVTVNGCLMLANGVVKAADSDAFCIYNGNGLLWFANYINNVSGYPAEGETVSIVRDIDLGGAAMPTIGVPYGKPLTVLGNGYTISNATTAHTEHNGMKHHGFFYAYTDSTLTISDLTFDNIVIDATNDSERNYGAGIVVAFMDGGSTVVLDNVDVNNCKVLNNTPDIGDEAGAFVGYQTGTLTMTDCDSVGCTVIGETAEKTGALIGMVNGTAAINNCTTDLTIGVCNRVAGTLTVDGNLWIANGLTKATDSNTYYVLSEAGLEAMHAKMADKTAGKATVINLMCDLDMEGYEWKPVDSHADTAFYLSGINGNGHTIKNLTVKGQAMFSRFAGSGDVVIKDIIFDNANVIHSSINAAILAGHSYQNVLLDNVDVKNSTITGGYKVAPLIATVYNENASTITATLKNCDVSNTTVKATSYDFCTTGLVAFVYADDNDKIEFENCTVTGVKLYAPNVYSAHAWVYTTDSDTLFNEADGVTVSDCTFENI